MLQSVFASSVSASRHADAVSGEISLSPAAVIAGQSRHALHYSDRPGAARGPSALGAFRQRRSGTRDCIRIFKSGDLSARCSVASAERLMIFGLFFRPGVLLAAHPRHRPRDWRANMEPASESRCRRSKCALSSPGCSLSAPANTASTRPNAYCFSPTEIAGNSTCRIIAAIFGTSSVLSCVHFFKLLVQAACRGV